MITIKEPSTFPTTAEPELEAWNAPKNTSGSADLGRLISRVVVMQTENSRLENLDTGKQQGTSYYRDNRNIGLWAKKRARELGADLGPQFEETLEKARSGKILLTMARAWVNITMSISNTKMAQRRSMHTSCSTV